MKRKVISNEDFARWRVKVIINHEYVSKKELKEIAKIAAEFEKEYAAKEKIWKQQ